MPTTPFSGWQPLTRRASRAGIEADEEKISAAREFLKQRMVGQMDALYYTTYSVDDGVIDPRDTRTVLGMCLSAVCNAPIDRAPGAGIARL